MAEPRIKCERFELANGIKVVAAQQRWSRSFAALMCVEVGTRDDPPGFAGTAHLLEHLQFSGQKAAWHERLEQLGISINAYTAWDRTCFRANGHVELLGATLKFFKLLLDPLSLSLKDLHREIRIIEHELTVEASSTSSIDFRLRQVIGQVIGDHRYGDQQIYNVDRLKRWQPQQLESYHATWYAPSNVSLFLVSKYEPAEIRKFAARLLGTAPNRGDSIVRRAYRNRPPPRLAILRSPGTHVAILLCYAVQCGEPIPSPAIMLVSDYLAGGPYSVLFDLIRKKHQWAYHVHGNVLSIGPTTIMQLHTLVSREYAYKALELVVGRLDLLRESGLTADQFNLVRKRSLHQLTLIEDDPVGLCSFLAEAPAADRNQFATPHLYASALRSYSPADMNRFVSALLSPSRRTVILVGQIGTQTSVLAERLLGN